VKVLILEMKLVTSRQSHFLQNVTWSLPPVVLTVPDLDGFKVD